MPIIASTTRLMDGQDMLAELSVKDYLHAMGERATVKVVNAERKINTELMMARAAKKLQP